MSICDPGRKGFDAEQVDDDAALDAAHEFALNGVARVVRGFDLVPHAHEVGLLLRQHHATFEVLNDLEKDLDFAADFDGLRIVAEFPDGDHALGFEADVDEHLAGLDADDAALDDFAFLDAREALFVERLELLHLLFVVLGDIKIFDLDFPVHRFGGFLPPRGLLFLPSLVGYSSNLGAFDPAWAARSFSPAIHGRLPRDVPALRSPAPRRHITRSPAHAGPNSLLEKLDLHLEEDLRPWRRDPTFGSRKTAGSCPQTLKVCR